MKTYKYYSPFGHTFEIYLERNSYMNGSLAVLMMNKDDGDIYADLTRNLGNPMQTENRAFIDTNNLGDGIKTWLKTNGIAKDTGIRCSSGYCVYPLFEFNENI